MVVISISEVFSATFSGTLVVVTSISGEAFSATFSGAIMVVASAFGEAFSTAFTGTWIVVTSNSGESLPDTFSKMLIVAISVLGEVFSMVFSEVLMVVNSSLAVDVSTSVSDKMLFVTSFSEFEIGADDGIITSGESDSEDSLVERDEGTEDEGAVVEVVVVTDLISLVDGRIVGLSVIPMGEISVSFSGIFVVTSILGEEVSASFSDTLIVVTSIAGREDKVDVCISVLVDEDWVDITEDSLVSGDDPTVLLLEGDNVELSVIMVGEVAVVSILSFLGGGTELTSLTV